MAGASPFFVFGGPGEPVSFPTIGGQPACITRGEFEACCCGRVEEILITSLDPQDDDLRVRVGGITVWDRRYNVSWYFGENGEYGNTAYNPAWATSGFAAARITRAMAAAAGAALVSGAEVQVDVLDGWGGGWRTSPWEAVITYSSGPPAAASGGAASSGSSAPDANPAAPPDPYTYGPHFLAYHSNGSFVIP